MVKQTVLCPQSMFIDVYVCRNADDIARGVGITEEDMPVLLWPQKGVKMTTITTAGRRRMLKIYTLMEHNEESEFFVGHMWEQTPDIIVGVPINVRAVLQVPILEGEINDDHDLCIRSRVKCIGSDRVIREGGYGEMILVPAAIVFPKQL